MIRITDKYRADTTITRVQLELGKCDNLENVLTQLYNIDNN